MSRFYKTLDIPIENWDFIQKGDNLDVRYLFKKAPKRLPIFYNKKKLYKFYLDILYQFPEMDTKIQETWIKYVGELVKYKILLEQNTLSALMQSKKKKIILSNLNRTFEEYITQLEEQYTEFEFDVYFLRPDYKEVWDFDRKIPKDLIKNEGLEFFLAEEYIDLVKDFPIVDAVFLMTPEFYKKFIDKRVEKFDNLQNINQRLYNFFKGVDQMDKWRLIRSDLFSLNKLDFVPKKDNDMLKEIALLRKVNNQGAAFSMKSTLREYFTQIEIAKQSQPESKPNGQ